MGICLSQANNTAHWVPFRFVHRYFISVLLSPPAAHYFARRLSPFRLRSLSAALISLPDTWLIRPSFRHAALISLASFRRLRALREIYFGGSTWSWHRHSSLMAFLPAPHGGSQQPSFVVPPLFGCLRRLASQATVRTSVPHSYASFLPQALLPAGLTHCLASKKAILIYE